MDDDLGTPGAVAVLHDTVREGNRLLTEGAAIETAYAEVVSMLTVLGLDPADPAWGPAAGGDEKLTAAVDVLVAGLLESRAAAREAKDWAAADAIRDQLKAAGIEITDGPNGPEWTVA
jgi:cysteinyl-tRNA synthetase